jgi:hypothetical protein
MYVGGFSVGVTVELLGGYRFGNRMTSSYVGGASCSPVVGGAAIEKEIHVYFNFSKCQLIFFFT